MSDDLLVLLYGEVVGVLQRDSAGEQPSFQYLPEYVQSGSVALSARLTIRSGPYPPRQVGPFLAGLIPENIETRQRWARSIGTPDGDVFEMLSEMGWDCPGAVQFCRAKDLDELLERSSSYQALTEADVARRLHDLAVDPASWTMPEEHWSLGGQQEKFALAWIDGTWHEARGAAATTHILKPGIRALQHQAIVEHATMAAASTLGVDIANTALQCFEDQWAIVIDRFDRELRSDGTVDRIHQEDFCQALGRHPDRKYEDQNGPTLADMVRILKQHSTDLEDDKLALADFLIINVVAGAPDGHSKNISIMRTASRNWVAPLYDLASALAYETITVGRAVALSVGGERHPARIFSRQWIKAAQTLGLSADVLLARVALLASSFPSAYDEALEAMTYAPGAAEVADRSTDKVQRHCEGILSRL